MKKELKTELPISYSNLAWRVFAPLTTLELLGYGLDRALNLHKFFKISLAIFALTLTVWGLLVTARETVANKDR